MSEDNDVLELPADFCAQNQEHNDFMDMYLAFKKRGELKRVYEAIGVDHSEPEKAIVFFKKALIDTEEELAKNPDSSFMQEQKTEIERYLAKVYKILEMEKESLPEIKSPKLDHIYNIYPIFKQHFPYLLKYDFIFIREDGSFGTSNNSFIFEYIDKYIKHKGKQTNWAVFETLLGIKNLRNAKGEHKETKTADFMKWEKIIKDIPNSI
jgi:hypothetical protein